MLKNYFITALRNLMRNKISKKALGEIGQKLAERIYLFLGHNIVDRYINTKFGEIDLLTMHNGVNFIIEIKICSNEAFGSAYEKWEIHQKKTFAKIG